MWIRALIVLLVVLNLGVVVWWVSQPEPPPYRPVQPGPGIAPLELVTESELQALASMPAEVDADAPAADDAIDPATPATDDVPEPVAAAAPEPPAAPPARCYRLGPFAGRDQAVSAQSTLGGHLRRARISEVAPPSQSAERFRILYPPLPSRAEAQEMARRINAAGFQDYFLIENGEFANGIALGIYRNRQGAERQIEALNAAGFSAKMIHEKEGNAASQWWLEAEAVDITANALRRQAHTAQVQSLDCGALR
ncbi:MAG: SPOR domain-containing protein [Xanthomonadaceae bacterium]|jgi:hypothetical protein|nr:SPOR domain-containing protein [Xanthomonadaceae bacterium]